MATIPPVLSSKEESDADSYQTQTEAQSKPQPQPAAKPQPPSSSSSSEESSSDSDAAAESGVEKSQSKKRKGEDMSAIVKDLLEANAKMCAYIKESTAKRLELLEQEVAALKEYNHEFKKANDFAEWEADIRILLMDSKSIAYSGSRSYIQQEQARILEKKMKPSS